jgi:hypothetical protein
VNTEDIEVVEPEAGIDMLEAIFTRQKELMVKYHDIEEANGLLETSDVPVDIHSKEGQQRLKNFAWRVTEELGEAMNTLKNKPWKQTHMLTDVKHYNEEISDAFHFFIELCILSGIGSKELYDLYFRKSEVNKFRQESKY